MSHIELVLGLRTGFNLGAGPVPLSIRTPGPEWTGGPGGSGVARTCVIFGGLDHDHEKNG
jgi:hypothetical protein